MKLLYYLSFPFRGFEAFHMNLKAYLKHNYIIFSNFPKICQAEGLSAFTKDMVN